MKRFIITGLLSLILAFSAFAQTNVIAQASQLELKGDFKQACALLNDTISQGQSSPDELKALHWELDRMQRIRKDYNYTHYDLYNDLKAAVKNLTPSEFDDWVNRGWFNERTIDGQNRFFHNEVSNFFFRHPEFAAREIPPPHNGHHERLTLKIVKAIEQAANEEKTPYVLPKTLIATMNLTVNSGVASNGEIIRAWVPIPRHYPFQYDFKLLSSSVPPKSIATEDSPIRSIYFEEPARANHPTEFSYEFEYTIRGVHFNLDPAKITPFDTNDAELEKFTQQQPEIVFTPGIKELSAKIVGDEKNPMLRAKKIYDWLADNLSYSYAIEYSTIRNLSDYCRTNKYGDCGQQAMLFITLCRYNGIPARWQTGWDLFPGDEDIHDWSEIYLAPYGWIPVDPYMANYAMRYITTLTPAEKLTIRDFYFGGLDQYRMNANSDNNQTLHPPKQSFRSDDIDFQRGELEHSGKNIYFDQYTYEFSYRIVPPPALQ
jgi:transglutaminase-like putative cysteine protease